MSERTQSEKIGFISLKPMPDGRFQARWWDAEASKYMRRVIPTTSHKEAVKIARGFNTEILSDTGFIPSIRGEQGHTVREALEESIRGRRASAKTKKQYGEFSNQFIVWLGVAFPGIRRWGELRPMHFSAYLNSCLSEGFAFDTIRLRFVPLKGASTFMADNYDGYGDAARKVKLPRQHRQRNDKPVPDAKTLDAFLAYLREHRPALAPMVALQSLAGLRMREMMAIREQDIDLRKRTVRVTDTPIHSVKTTDSDRTIPVCASVAAALAWALGHRKTIHGDGYAFTTRLGGPWTQDGYYSVLKREMRAFAAEVREKKAKGEKTELKPAEAETIANLAPREFRATFGTLVRGMGADHNATKAYLGQAPDGILERHYERITADRLRDEIVARLDGKGTGESLFSLPSDLHQTYIQSAAIIEIAELTG